MTLVLTSGHADSRHEAAHALLVAAGLADISPPTDSAPTGLLAGWAETNPPGRLEALAAAQPDLRFVLVYAAPQVVLAKVLQGQVAQPEAVHRVLADWLAAHDDLLRFANRHPDRCVLVDADCILQAPQAFVAHVAESFGLPLVAEPQPLAAERGPTDSLAHTLAQALLRGRHDVTALLLELHSQATLDAATQDVAQREPAQAWQQFADLLTDRLTQTQRVEALAAQLAVARRSAAEQAEQAEQRERRQAQEHQRVNQELASRLGDQAADELARMRTERDQLAAAVQQHVAQVDAMKQAEAQWRAQLALQPVSARVTEASQENELLLLQLHQVQEELERYYTQHLDLAARAEADAALLSFMRDQWQASQPEEVVIDLRREVLGRNWHEIEPDGRWAGPGTASLLRWPALRPGMYNVALDIVDAMQPDILQGTELRLNGQRIETELLFDGFPALLTGNVVMPEVRGGWWELELRFPCVGAPSERGEPDERQLALRIRSVRLTSLEAP